MFSSRVASIAFAVLAAIQALPAVAQNAAAGGGLYSAYCLSCHGAVPSGGPDRAQNNPARIRAAISGGVLEMRILSFLTDAQLADIAAYVAQVLGGGPPPAAANYTALWWNPAESGWGVNFNHQGNTLFGTLFTYDASGAPLWLVMSNGVESDAVSFAGDLFRTTGPAFNANPFTPIGAANVTRVGTMTVSFSGANAGTLRYTVNGVEVSKAIQRQVYGQRAATCERTTESRANATNYQDLWWNPAEAGWGVNVTHQDNTLFATLFTYDAGGRDLWLVMSAGERQTDGSYLGNLYRTTGPAFNANPFTPIGAGNLTTVGTMRFRFTDGNSGTLSYTYNGVAVAKAITRQVFSSPVSLCQ